LSKAGFATGEIDVLHGEKDLRRLDPTGAEHGFLARFHRTLIREARIDEYKHLIHHVDDVRAGRFVVMVHTKKRAHRDVAAKILSSHGAEFIVFYGRWAYEELDGHHHGSDITPTTEQKNMALMQALDDAWNAQDWDSFEKHHKSNVIVRWPAKPETHGRRNHRAAAIQMCTTFPDAHVHNRPYRMCFANGDWTCSVSQFTGTMKGPMIGFDGKEIAPTGKSFELDLCTVARWDNGEIVEATLFYDVAALTHQIS
jgi:predicted ester cyclase